MKSKRILCLVLCFAVLFFPTAPVRAQAGDTVINEGTFQYRITGAGAEVIQYSGNSSVVDVPAQVQGYPVVAIGDEVFRNSDGITRVVLHEGIRTIGNRAFYACTDLESISMPDSLTSIGDMGFANCYALRALQIPVNVGTIGTSAFANCSSLQNLQVASGNTHFKAVDNVVFSADMSALLIYLNSKANTTYTVPDQVRRIGEKAFLECGYLREVTLPAGLLQIEKYAFSGCTSLTQAVIPDSVQSIGSFAFSNCSGLTSVKLGAGITTVASYTFQNCSQLHSAQFPDGLQSIGSRAFYRCGTFQEICFPDAMQQIAGDAFSGTTVTQVRFYSTVKKNAFAGLFPGSRIICLCKAEHTYPAADPINCSVCDYVLDLDAPPVLSSVTHDTVQLVPQTSFEYSYDRVHWRQDGLFTGLNPNQTYNFYGRHTGVQSGKVSQPLSVTTDRAQQQKAPDPVVQSADENSITLKAVSGCEYSRDGVNWQTGTRFTGLQPNTQYTFYQRYAQTGTHYAGPISNAVSGGTSGATQLSSDKYTVKNGIISKIPAGTTVQMLLSGLKGGGDCVVYKGSAAQNAKAKAGTGMTVRHMSGSKILSTYTLVVTGDTNGDGEITITDMIAVKAHILKKTLLTGVQAQAADTSGDGGISITDFIQIKAKILGKGTITAR